MQASPQAAYSNTEVAWKPVFFHTNAQHGKLLASILLALLFVTPLRAQESGQLAGAIHDQSGAALTGVVLTLQGPKTQQIGKTDEAGDFEFRDLPEGDYEITAELSGFGPAHRNVRVRSGSRITLSLTLDLTI